MTTTTTTTTTTAAAMIPARDWQALGWPLPEGVTIEPWPFDGPGKPLKPCFVKDGRLWPIGFEERREWRTAGVAARLGAKSEPAADELLE